VRDLDHVPFRDAITFLRALCRDPHRSFVEQGGERLATGIGKRLREGLVDAALVGPSSR